MAAPLGGMFSGQPPGPPQPPPGLPGQASLLQATPGAARISNSTLVDELESSFEACFASLVSQDYVNGTDQEEIRTGVDQCIQKFLDIARQTECFFLQKDCSYLSRNQSKLSKRALSDFVRGIKSTDIPCIGSHFIALRSYCIFYEILYQQKDDDFLKAQMMDVSELRNELQRKDALVQKHLTKLRHWQQVLEDINVQHKKPAEIPQGSLAYLEQASANIPAPMKQT